MILDFLMKIFITPENIIGVVINVLGIVGMCLIFTLWDEGWWKSLVPIYGTFVLYKHTWSNYIGAFVAQTLFALGKMGSLSFSKKHITSNLFSAIKDYLETGQFSLDISISKLLIAIVVFLICLLVTWIFQLITYLKICDKLNVRNPLFKIGVVLFPDLFLFIIYFYYRRKNRGENS